MSSILVRTGRPEQMPSSSTQQDKCHGQEQHPPPQQPPPLGVGAWARPVTPPRLSSLTVSSWPSGQVAGSEEALIARVSTNVDPHARQRNS
jgi:hypothetical protein